MNHIAENRQISIHLFCLRSLNYLPKTLRTRDLSMAKKWIKIFHSSDPRQKTGSFNESRLREYILENRNEFVFQSVLRCGFFGNLKALYDHLKTNKWAEFGEPRTFEAPANVQRTLRWNISNTLDNCWSRNYCCPLQMKPIFSESRRATFKILFSPMK